MIWAIEQRLLKVLEQRLEGHVDQHHDAFEPQPELVEVLAVEFRVVGPVARPLAPLPCSNARWVCARSSACIDSNSA